MEYHFVVMWVEGKGWEIDWGSTIARFQAANVYAPNLDEWLMPVHDSETGRKEDELVSELQEALDIINFTQKVV